MLSKRYTLNEKSRNDWTTAKRVFVLFDCHLIHHFTTVVPPADGCFEGNCLQLGVIFHVTSPEVV